MAFYSKYMDEPKRVAGSGWEIWSNYYFVPGQCQNCVYCEEKSSNWPITCHSKSDLWASRKAVKHYQQNNTCITFQACQGFKEREKEEERNTNSSDIFVEEKNKQLDQKMAEFERSQQEALKRQEHLREEEQRQIEYEREQQRIAFEKQQEELELQREQLELQEEKRQESLRLDYCGHCHNPITFDYEEIVIDTLKYRIHKTCMESFKSSGSEMYVKWQETNKRIEEERLKKQAEFENKKREVESWISEDEDGQELLREFETKKPDADEQTKIETLYLRMISHKKQIELTIKENDLWIKNTDEGKTFEKQCSETNPRKRLYLIKEARVDYENRQWKLQREAQMKKEAERIERDKKEKEKELAKYSSTPIIKKLESIINDESVYFKEKQIAQVDNLLKGYISTVQSIENVEMLKKYELVQNLDLEKVPAKKKLWRTIIRVYLDVFFALLLGGIGYSFIYMIPNTKGAVISLSLAVLFLMSPVIGKVATKKQITAISNKNIAKLRELFEEKASN